MTLRAAMTKSRDQTMGGTKGDPEAGFTLIEALVAMAVLATGAVSLLSAAQSQAGRVSDLSERTVARWVAENALVDLRLGFDPTATPITMMGSEWTVTAERSATTDPDLQGVLLAVAPFGPGLREGSNLVVLQGYIDTKSAGGAQ